MPQPTVAKTVPYTFTERDVIAYYEVMAKRQARIAGSRRSLLSTIYAPVALGVLLMIVCSLRDAGTADFARMLVAGTVAYYGGIIIYGYEISRAHAHLRTSIYRNEPFYRGQRHVTLAEYVMEYSAANLSSRIPYGAFTDVEQSHGLILAWIGNLSATAVPLRAFASSADANAFVEDLRSRVHSAHSAGTTSR
jgi:hypothetical protein